VEDRMVEINEAERKKRMKRNEDNLKDLWDCQMPQHLNHRSPRRRQKERP